MAEHLLEIKDFLAVRDRWLSFGNIGTCEIRTCIEPAVDYIYVQGNDTYYFCHKHFMELLHQMSALPEIKK